MAPNGIARLPALLGIVLPLMTVGCLAKSSDRPSSTPGQREGTSSPRELSSQTIQEIERFCSDCHALPIPATFPKHRWPDEVRQGFEFYVESKRTDLSEPIRHEAIKYYQDRAPERIIVPRADQLPVEASPVNFQRAADFRLSVNSTDSSSTETKSNSGPAPAIAHLIWNPHDQAVYFTDMLQGTFRQWHPRPFPTPGQLSPLDTVLASGRHFCKATRCDWDNDGISDFLMGEMGTFQVADHQLGGVTLLRGLPDGSYQSHILANNLGRVVQAVPFDFDDDGDLDVLVAEFGWRKTGALKLLRNPGTSGLSEPLPVEILDPRHGILGVEVADMNLDGKLDIVACFGQEFETIEIYYNQGHGEYTPTVIHRLADPSYNASAFQVVDIDGDGRLDIVHTCGDTMDALIAKPYHGLRWIRNQPDGRWQNHELGLLVGALSCVTADFDGDGDLDIAAVGLFPDAHLDGPGAYDSVCWWEQRDNLQFTRHAIERDTCWHAACTAGDVDGDGRIDLIVGQWLAPDKTAIRVYFNKPAE